MASLGKYLLGIFACALICGIAMELVGKKSGNGPLIRFLCGVFMLLCVVCPLLDIRVGPLTDLTGQIRQEANVIVQDGKNLAKDHYRAGITQRTQAYILDKAVSLGADIEAEVILSEDDYAAPKSVTVRGRISPYAKGLLSAWLESELGIEAEEQIWIASN